MSLLIFSCRSKKESDYKGPKSSEPIEKYVTFKGTKGFYVNHNYHYNLEFDPITWEAFLAYPDTLGLEGRQSQGTLYFNFGPKALEDKNEPDYSHSNDCFNSTTTLSVGSIKLRWIQENSKIDPGLDKERADYIARYGEWDPDGYCFHSSYGYTENPIPLYIWHHLGLQSPGYVTKQSFQYIENARREALKVIATLRYIGPAKGSNKENNK
ncbi:MAG: hypothetical protein HY401_02340 [Elusimicrobia bacterium]|nr:hypothetical protein [Elusimicrobiota bacterium]